MVSFFSLIPEASLIPPTGTDPNRAPSEIERTLNEEHQWNLEAN